MRSKKAEGSNRHHVHVSACETIKVPIPGGWIMKKTPGGKAPGSQPDVADQGVGPDRGGGDLSARLRAVAPSIQMFSRDQAAGVTLPIHKSAFGNFAGFFLAFLIGAGAMMAWQSYGNDAKQIVETWIPFPTKAASPSAVTSVATAKSRMVADVSTEHTGSIPAVKVSAPVAAPQPSPVEITPAPAPTLEIPIELTQQIEAMARDLAVVRQGVEQLAARQDRMTSDIAALRATEQDIRNKLSAPPAFAAVPLPPRRHAPMAMVRKAPALASPAPPSGPFHLPIFSEH